MLSLIFATIIVCQTPDFRSVSVTQTSNKVEIPPTAEIGPAPCDCGCASFDCKCQAKIKELEKELARFKAVLYNTKKSATPTMYTMVDSWGYAWKNTDKIALSDYVNGLNSGRIGHPRYNEIVLKHTQILPQTVYSAGAVCTLPGGG